MGSAVSQCSSILAQHPKSINGFLIGVVENIIYKKQYGKKPMLEQLVSVLKRFFMGGLYGVLEFLYLDTFLSLIAGHFGCNNWNHCFTNCNKKKKLTMVMIFVLIEQFLLIFGKYIYKQQKHKNSITLNKKPSILTIIKQ